MGALAKIGFGVGHLTAFGLIVSSIIAPLTALATTIGLNFKRQIGQLLHFDRTTCRVMAREYANFPKFSLPRALVNNLSGALPALLLTPFFGLANLGFWGMAITLAFTPMSLISKSLYQVFYQRTAECVNQRTSIAPFFRKFIKDALLIVVPTFALLYFVLPALTRWLLGAEWEISGHYIRVMLPWLLMSVLVAPICFLSDIFKKQKIGLYLEVLLIVLRLLGLGIGIWQHSFFYAIAGYSIAGAIVIGVQLLWYLSLVRNYERGLQTE